MALVNYRAVHTKTLWRKVANHQTLENAINGKDGAAGLFQHKARIDYKQHGEPLFVIVWESGAKEGVVLTIDVASSNSMKKVAIPVAQILQYESSEQAPLNELEKLFK